MDDTERIIYCAFGLMILVSVAIVLYQTAKVKSTEKQKNTTNRIQGFAFRMRPKKVMYRHRGRKNSKINRLEVCYEFINTEAREIKRRCKSDDCNEIIKNESLNIDDLLKSISSLGDCPQYCSKRLNEPMYANEETLVRKNIS